MALKLKFCPHCSTTMIYNDRDGAIYRRCPKCGYEEKLSEIYVQQEHKTKPRVTVIDEEEKKIRKMPTTKIACPRCSYGTAYCWTAQTRSGDESSTQFFKCKKCGYTWRLYS